MLVVLPAVAAVAIGAAGSEGRELRSAAKPDQQLTAFLTRDGSTDPLLHLSGPGFERGDATDKFEVVGRIRSVPCTGDHKFESIGRFTNGDSVPYRATIAISEISRRPRSLRCGRALPRRVGRRKTTIEVRKAFSGAPKYPDTPLRLDLHGARRGRLAGTVWQRAVLCNGQFRLVARFKGRHRTRVYSYRFVVRDATLDGNPMPNCSDL